MEYKRIALAKKAVRLQSLCNNHLWKLWSNEEVLLDFIIESCEFSLKPFYRGEVEKSYYSTSPLLYTLPKSFDNLKTSRANLSLCLKLVHDKKGTIFTLLKIGQNNQYMGR